MAGGFAFAEATAELGRQLRGSRPITWADSRRHRRRGGDRRRSGIVVVGERRLPARGRQLARHPARVEQERPKLAASTARRCRARDACAYWSPRRCQSPPQRRDSRRLGTARPGRSVAPEPSRSQARITSWSRRRRRSRSSSSSNESLKSRCSSSSVSISSSPAVSCHSSSTVASGVTASSGKTASSPSAPARQRPSDQGSAPASCRLPHADPSGPWHRTL